MSSAQLHEIFEKAASYYEGLLKGDKKAIGYLKSRGHNGELVKKFRVGWTGTDRKGLTKLFQEDPFTPEEMILSSGLVRKSDKGDLYDFFPPEVIVFPVMKDGKINHFRLKDPDKREKCAYQFPKEFNLNGQLFFNQDDFRRSRVVLVEGENDVLTVRRIIESEGIDLGVMGCNGGLSSEQIDYLKQNAKGKEIFCFFDRDQAGKRYNDRMIEACAGMLDLNIIEYGDDGDDPDSYFRKPDPVGLRDLISNGVEGITWFVFQLPNADSGLTAKKAIKPAIDIIAKIEDKLLIDMLIDDAVRKKYPSLKRQVIVELLKRAGADLGTKVQSFEIYDPNSQIFVSENSYWIPTTNDRKMISNFKASITNIYNYEDAQTGETYLKYECVLTNYDSAKTKPIIFEPADRVNPLKFMEKAGGQGDFRFWGNAQNLSHVWSFIEQNSDNKDITMLVQRYGYLRNHGIWLFENCAISDDGKMYEKTESTVKIGDKAFKSENVLVYGGDKPYLNHKINLSQNEIEEIFENYWLVCDGRTSKINEFKGFLVLGFMAASVYRNEIMESNGSFPLMFFYGPSGTGKTTCAQILFRMFGFINPPETWESATVASLSQMMTQLSCLPVFLDEYRNNSNKRGDALISLLRNAWNGAGAGKGGARGIRQIFNILSVIMLAGEDLPADKGGLSRFVVLRFSELNAVRNESYQWLMKNRDKLSAVYLKVIREKDKSKITFVINKAKEINETLLSRGVMDERTRMNYASVLAGFFLLGYRTDDQDFIDALFDYVVTEALEDIARKQQEDVLQRFFEHVARLMDKGPFSLYCKIVDNETLAIAFNEFYHELKKELRQAGDDLDSFKKSTVLDYILKSHFFIKNEDNRKDKPTRFSDSVLRRAIHLNIAKMPEMIRELFDDFSEKGSDF